MARKPLPRPANGTEFSDRIQYLPTVQDCDPKTKGGGGRNFYVVKRTGDYGMDCALGEGLARTTLQMLAAEQEADKHLAICWILQAMVRGGVVEGVEVGFLAAIADRALGRRRT